MAVYMGGVLVQNSFSNYNTLVHAKKALGADRCSDKTLTHPEICRATSYHTGTAFDAGATAVDARHETYDGLHNQLAIVDWEGFLGTAEPGIIDTGLFPQITIEITLADNIVCPHSSFVVLIKLFCCCKSSLRFLQFIQNSMKMFHNVEWRNGTLIEGFDAARYKGTYVKVLVYEKKSETKFDQFLDSLYAAEPASVSIIEDLSDRVREEGEVDISEDTLSLINKEIDDMEAENKEELKNIVRELYMESLD
jgi:hypothetical protein